MMRFEDKFQPYSPQTHKPIPFPHSIFRHKEVIQSLLCVYNSYVENFILIFVVAVEGVRMTLHDHHRDDLAISVDIAEMVHTCATEVHKTLHNTGPDSTRNPDDPPVSKSTKFNLLYSAFYLSYNFYNLITNFENNNLKTFLYKYLLVFLLLG